MKKSLMDLVVIFFNLKNLLRQLPKWSVFGGHRGTSFCLEFVAGKLSSLSARPSSDKPDASSYIVSHHLT